MRTLEAAANMALRGAHFKHEGTPIWLLQHATCMEENQMLVIFRANTLIKYKYWFKVTFFFIYKLCTLLNNVVLEFIKDRDFTFFTQF